MIKFAFETIETIGARRLEARVARNRKPEGMFHMAYLPNRGYLDQLLGTILDDHWQAKVIWGSGKLH